MDAIRVRPQPPDTYLAGLHRYRPNGVTDTLPGYWLALALFGIGADGAPARAATESVDMAIGLHLCRLRRPLGPREIRFLRAGIGVSQAGLGRLLGYLDKQRVAAAEKLTGAPRPLVPTAEMLLRSNYLGMHGWGHLSGTDYRCAAMAVAGALTAPPQGDLPATAYLVTM